MAEGFVCLADFEREAEKRVPKKYWVFISSGADDQITLVENRKAFRRLMLRPRVLKHYTRSIDLSTTVLGQTIGLPVGIGPTMGHDWLHPKGNICAARAAAAVGSPLIAGMRASSSLEDIAQFSPYGVKWFMFVMMQDRRFVRHLLQRAEAAGCTALVWKVDGSLDSRKLNVNPNAFDVAKEAEVPNIVASLPDGVPSELVRETAENWEMLHWLRSLTKLPIIVKGIQHPDDALLAVKHGASAIIVSNIGGRSLDGVPAIVDSLPEIIKAVGGKIEVYCDGGIRSGQDVFKCLALGAKAVFVGRPILWGLACDGEAGVKAVLDILKKELTTAMYHCGCSSLAKITSDLVTRKYRYANL